jgi:hypothetical protein
MADSTSPRIAAIGARRNNRRLPPRKQRAGAARLSAIGEAAASGYPPPGHAMGVGNECTKLSLPRESEVSKISLGTPVHSPTVCGGCARVYLSNRGHAVAGFPERKRCIEREFTRARIGVSRFLGTTSSWSNRLMISRTISAFSLRISAVASRT